MKKSLSTLLVLCVVFIGIIFSGCGVKENILDGGPAYEDAVYGNGGMVVVKGDYAYFASGFFSDDTKKGNYSNSGTGKLYRMKITLSQENTEEENYSQALESKQLMISKTVGFKGGGLYVFKDKIYFSSPSTVRDKTGLRDDLVTFYSCNLDGSGLKTLYQTTEWNSNATSSMTMINSSVYLIVYTGNTILKIGEDGAVTEMATDVTGVSFPKRVDILNVEENPNPNECFIYYTKKTESELSINLGNTLYKKDITSNEEKELFQENYIDFTLLEINSGRLFYTRNNKDSSLDSQFFYSNSLEGEVFTNSEKQHTWGEHTSLTSLGRKEGKNLGVAFIFNNTIYIKGIEQEIHEITKTVTASSISFVSNGYIYYVNSSDFFRVNVTSDDLEPEKISDDLTPLTTVCDIDKDYFYFFVEDKESTSGYVLYRTALESIGTKNLKTEKIG